MNAHSCLVVLFLLGTVLASAMAQLRIVGGEISQITDSNYIVSLNRNGTYYCTGTLLSYSHVFTAARCIVGVPISQILVKAGRTNNNEVGRQSRGVQLMFYPQNYDPTTRNMDIGALKLHTPFNPTPRIGLASRCNSPLTVGTPLQVSGWGSLSEQSLNSVPNLHTVSVPIRRWQFCANRYATISIGITNTSLCAGNDTGDTCSFDTGAPGIVNGQLCAVVSFGRGCNRPNFPGVYTNLTNPIVQQFITTVLAK